MCTLTVALVGAGIHPSAVAYSRPGESVRIDVARGAENVDGGTLSSSISADGRFVAFETDAALLPSDINNLSDVYLHDQQEDRLELVSRSITGVSGVGPPNDAQVAPGTSQQSSNRLSFDPSISANGRNVSFTSRAVDLVGGDTNAIADVFVYNRRSGAMERVSVDSDGNQAINAIPPVRGSYYPSIDASGRFVSFTSDAANLVDDDTNVSADIFVHDRDTGRTVRVSVNSRGEQTQRGCEGDVDDLAPAECLLASPAPASSINASGRFVAFSSLSDSLVEDDANMTWDVFVHDRRAGRTERVSVASDGTEVHDPPSPEGPIAPWSGSILSGSEGFYPVGRAISANGRYVVFVSRSETLVPNDTNRGAIWSGFFGHDVFVHDRKTGRTERVSVEPDGREIRDNGPSPASDNQGPSISPDGRYVVFHCTFCGEIKPSAYGEQPGVAAYDRRTGEVSHNPEIEDSSGVAWGPAEFPDISRGGRHVSYRHRYTHPVDFPPVGYAAAFVWDRGVPLGVGVVEPSERNQMPVGLGSTESRLLTGTDPAHDATYPSGAGAEIVGATLAVRARYRDLYLKIEIDHIPGPRGVIGGVAAAGNPALIYGARFEVADTSYEVRISKQGEAGTLAQPDFALFECDETCTRIASLRGGYGTLGESVVTAAPLHHLNLDSDERISKVVVFSAAAGVAARPAAVLDEMTF